METNQRTPSRGRGRGHPRGRGGECARARGVSAPWTLHLGISKITEPESTSKPSTSQPSTSQPSTFSEKVLDKLALNRLSEKNRAKHLELREKKQVVRFLMPDTPSRKTKQSTGDQLDISSKKSKKNAKLSPKPVPCPLFPVTPNTAPQHVPLKKRKIVPPSSNMPSQCPDPEPSEVATNDSGYDDNLMITVPYGCGPEVTKTPDKKLSTRTCSTLTPSTRVVQVDDASNHDINAVIELVGFSPAPVPSTSSTAHGSSFEDDTEEEICKWEQTTGSDNDEADDGVITNVVFSRTNCPAVEDLTPEVLNALNVMDQQDDIALRELADEDMLNFSWSSDPNVFIGKREVFLGQPGPTFPIEGMSPLDVFLKIWDANIISQILKETNRYAEDMKTDPRLKQHASIKNWTSISEAELWSFLSIIMLQSLIPIPVEREYWKPHFKYLKIGRFEDIMSFKRFRLIKTCLHFVDNSSLSFSTGDQNRLAKIQPIIDHLNLKFGSLYLPGQEIAIDESLLLWKGRLSFAQLINTKAARVGIKSYELCESKSGYLWKMIIYAGKNQIAISEEHDVREEPEPEGAVSKIVLNLVRPLLHLGHTLVMDNFYNSPLLSRTLKNKKTDTMGTLRINREFVPDSLRIKTKSNMRTGEVACSQTRDMTIIVWRDANIVSLISTFHKTEVGGKLKNGYYRFKPKVVLDYNLSMGGVDKKDQLLQAFPVERIRNKIWYKKLFRRLLNVSIHNAHVIFSTGTKMSAREFRYRLADDLLRKFSPIYPETSVVVSAGQHVVSAGQHVVSTGQQHFPAKTGKAKSRCKLCAQNKKDVCTVWKCADCNMNLCMPDCFKAYHLSPNFLFAPFELRH